MTSADQSGSDRTLCLVSGYHAATFPPEDAYAWGLRHRFAVVLDTYRRDRADLYFDAELYLRLVPALCRAIGYDGVTIRMAGDGDFPSFDALAGHYAGQEEADRDPPERIELRQGGRCSGIVQTEAWAAVGGPAPYHDSYTLSFYTDRDRSEELRRVVEEVCAELGAVITGYHTGQPDKRPYRPWWRRALRWPGAAG